MKTPRDLSLYAHERCLSLWFARNVVFADDSWLRQVPTLVSFGTADDIAPNRLLGPYLERERFAAAALLTLL